MSKALTTTRSGKTQSYGFDRRIVRRLFNGLDVSTSTIKEYRQRIQPFLEYCKQHDLNSQTLVQYKRELSKKDGSTSTKNKYLTVARLFLRELHKEGFTPVDLSLNVRSFKQTKGHKRLGLTDEEIRRIGDHVTERAWIYQDYRLLAIVSLLTYHGLRQQEICNLRWGDIDFDNQTIGIRGKGRDDVEVVPLHKHCWTALQHYLPNANVPIMHYEKFPVFPSPTYSKHGQPISTRRLRQMIQEKVFEPLDINRTVHGFRHYYTTTLVDNSGGNLLMVMKQTRHKSLEVLQIYYDEHRIKKRMAMWHHAFPTFKFFEPLPTSVKF